MPSGAIMPSYTAGFGFEVGVGVKEGAQNLRRTR